MNETLWPHIIKWVAVILVAGIASCTGENVSRYAIYANSLNEATRAGKDPMAVGCAFGFGGTGEAAVCSLNQANAKH